MSNNAASSKREEEEDEEEDEVDDNRSIMLLESCMWGAEAEGELEEADYIQAILEEQLASRASRLASRPNRISS